MASKRGGSHRGRLQQGEEGIHTQTPPSATEHDGGGGCQCRAQGLERQVLIGQLFMFERSTDPVIG